MLSPNSLFTFDSISTGKIPAHLLSLTEPVDTSNHATVIDEEATQIECSGF